MTRGASPSPELDEAWRTEIEGQLAFVREHPLTTTWEDGVASVLQPVGEGYRDCHVSAKEEGDTVMVSLIEVDPRLHGFGIGANLMRELARQATARGFAFLDGGVTSGSALRTRIRVFGKENLDIRPAFGRPFTDEQKARLWDADNDLLAKTLSGGGLMVRVDLGHLPDDALQRPSPHRAGEVADAQAVEQAEAEAEDRRSATALLAEVRRSLQQ